MEYLIKKLAESQNLPTVGVLDEIDGIRAESFRRVIAGRAIAEVERIVLKDLDHESTRGAFIVESPR